MSCPANNQDIVVPDERVATPRWRFTIRSVLMFQFLISPLLLALLLVRSLDANSTASSMQVFNSLACAVFYSAVFAGRRGLQLLRSSPRQPMLPILPCIWTGALFGLLFIMLAWGPERAMQWAGHKTLDVTRLSETLFVLVSVGSVFGAFGGALVGIVLDIRGRKMRR